MAPDADTLSPQPLEVSLEDAEQRWRFRQARITLGRAAANDVVLADPRIARRHGRLIIGDRLVGYEDLGSSGGSRVARGQLLVELLPGEAPLPLFDGDSLLLGDPSNPLQLTVRIAAAMEMYASADAEILSTLAPQPIPHVPDSASRLLGLIHTLGRERTLDGLVATAAQALFELVPSTARLSLYAMAGESGAPGRSLGDLRRGPSSVSPPVAHRELTVRVAEAGVALLAAPAREAPHRGQLMLAPVLGSAGEAEVSALLCLEALEGSSGFDRADLELTSTLALHLGPAVERLERLERLARAERKLRSENQRLRARLVDEHDEELGERVVGTSPAMNEIRRNIALVAPTSSSVLIGGETGTGKEVVARAIHSMSARRAGPFAAVNCGAIPPNLLESELFGHKRGAFTGAVRDKLGLFQVADGGTLLLDEIGDMPPALQVKLLRVLDGGEVTSLGANRPVPVDVRILAATNRDLDAAVAEGEFREDLFYRLNVFPMRIPPLRERREDIAALARHFLAQRTGDRGGVPPRLGESAVAALGAYEFPGNARELLNEIERALLLVGDSAILEVEHFSPRIQAAAGRVATTLPPSEVEAAHGTLREVLAAHEAAYLRVALEREGGNRTRTAAALGISRQALLTKLKSHGIK